MKKTKKKDENKLEELNGSIIKLKKEIEELNKIKILNNKIKEKEKLEKKIIEFSTYKINQIGNILVKLMSVFEKVEYSCEKDFFYNGYNIAEYKTSLIIHPMYKLEILEGSKEEKCLLLPTFYKKENYKENTFYIQKFIDFLYENRSKNSFYNIDDAFIEEILNTFLQNSKEDQILRNQQINQSLKEKEMKEKEKKFEESCLINRKLIYNSIVYIINHYECNIIAIQKKEEEYERFSSWTNLYAIHKLIINNDKEEIEYESIIDKQGCYPDEEYCGLYVNKDKDSNICFFDIKRKLSLIIEKSTYLKKFMKMIEEHYYKEKNITSSDIENYLIILSNEIKIKKRVKKL